MKLRHSITGSLALGIVLLGGACTSQPSAKAVVLDTIDALDDVSQSVKDCMRDVVEAADDADGSEGSATLEQIAKSDPKFTSNPEVDADMSPQMQAFHDDLAACIGPR